MSASKAHHVAVMLTHKLMLMCTAQATNDTQGHALQRSVLASLWACSQGDVFNGRNMVLTPAASWCVPLRLRQPWLWTSAVLQKWAMCLQSSVAILCSMTLPFPVSFTRTDLSETYKHEERAMWRG